ncbi:sulfite exporter TauE/SafE family protein [Acidiphilium sp. AL]|nr:sulfite exporter TauE/SafE family protein [Acidiphilium sp. AL]
MLIASTPLFLVAGGLTALAAGFVKGFAGFGFAVVFTPLFSLISDDPRQVVFVALVLGAIMSLGVIAEIRHAIARDRTIPVVFGTMVGTPIGIMLLGLIDRPALKFAIAGLAIGITILRLTWFQIRIGPGAWPLAIGAFLGGILNGCTSMGGPVPALIVVWQRQGINDSRAILVMFNLLSYLLAITVALGTGIARLPWLISGVWLLPFAALGTFAGVHAVRRISQTTFAYVITAVVGLAGIAGVISVLKT